MGGSTREMFGCAENAELAHYKFVTIVRLPSCIEISRYRRQMSSVLSSAAETIKHLLVPCEGVARKAAADDGDWISIERR